MSYIICHIISCHIMSYHIISYNMCHFWFGSFCSSFFFVTSQAASRLSLHLIEFQRIQTQTALHSRSAHRRLWRWSRAVGPWEPSWFCIGCRGETWWNRGQDVQNVFFDLYNMWNKGNCVKSQHQMISLQYNSSVPGNSKTGFLTSLR